VTARPQGAEGPLQELEPRVPVVDAHPGSRSVNSVTSSSASSSPRSSPSRWTTSRRSSSPATCCGSSSRTPARARSTRSSATGTCQEGLLPPRGPAALARVRAADPPVAGAAGAEPLPGRDARVGGAGHLPATLLAIALLTVFVSGVAMWFAGVNVVFRDLQELFVVLFQVWFYATPVLYPLGAGHRADGRALRGSRGDRRQPDDGFVEARPHPGLYGSVSATGDAISPLVDQPAHLAEPGRAGARGRLGAGRLRRRLRRVPAPRPHLREGGVSMSPWVAAPPAVGQLAGAPSTRTRPAIVVDGVTETFRLFHERPSGLKERLYRPSARATPTSTRSRTSASRSSTASRSPSSATTGRASRRC
jgi:hypothetical protein